jgi:hypothetical protein
MEGNNCYCNDFHWKLFQFFKKEERATRATRDTHTITGGARLSLSYISIMFTALKEACIALGAISFVYSVALNITRHATKDDKSVFDTIQDVALNSSALAISWIIYKRCIDEDLCMVRN